MKNKTLFCFVLLILIRISTAVFAHSADYQHGAVVVQIDGGTRYQTWEGIGASFTPFDMEGIYKAHDPSQPETVSVIAAQKEEIARLLYSELGITRTRFVLRGFEPSNDNDDPLTLNPAGFEWVNSTVDASIEFMKIGQAYGLQEGWLSFAIDRGHQEAWRRLGDSPCALDPAQIDEEVEWLLAAVLHLRDSGVETRYMAVNNEPDLCPPGYKIEIADMVSIIKRLGARLRQEGLNTHIVVSDGWIPQNALLYMQAALDDPDARPYVGALAYHSYDAYGNPDVLRQSAEGNPPHDAAEIRTQIRDLAAQYDLPVWMTEVCYCTPIEGFGFFELAVLRLNHLFDELTITHVSAFDGMNVAFIERA